MELAAELLADLGAGVKETGGSWAVWDDFVAGGGRFRGDAAEEAADWGEEQTGHVRDVGQGERC